MLRKPTIKRIKEQRKKELLALASASALASTKPGTSSSETQLSEHLSIVPSTSRTGRLYNFKKRIMRSRLGKSLSRLDERRSSLGKRPTDSSDKSVITEKECHSAVEFLEHSSSNSHNDLTGL